MISGDDRSAMLPTTLRGSYCWEEGSEETHMAGSLGVPAIFAFWMLKAMEHVWAMPPAWNPKRMCRVF